MSARAKRHLGFFRALRAAKAEGRKRLLRECSPDALKALCELALNALKGNIPLNPRQLKALKKAKACIKALFRKSTTSKKKRLILQRGRGFLLPLLGAAIPLLTSLITGRG